MNMADAKRREAGTARARPRTKSEEDRRGDSGGDPAPAEPALSEPAIHEGGAEEEGFVGFDEETNNRYEEIKRGGTHITELQQMTMPQLLKTAKDEGISEYTGLKKQDLIFKILK